MTEEKQKKAEEEKTEKKKELAKAQKGKIEEKKEKEETEKKAEEKPAEEETKEEKKAEKKEAPKKRKTEVSVRALNLPVSTKQSVAICGFIKNKKISDAIADLEQVSALKRAVPMKGEIPHRKAMMSGRFPQRAARHFIVLLRSLAANASVNELEEPLIIEAVANIGSRPYGRFGTVRKKRTHVKIKAREIKTKKK